MLEKKTYEALVEFNLNLENGKMPLVVKPGQEILFDGRYVKVGDVEGFCQPLAKMVGEWIKEIRVNTSISEIPKQVDAAPAAPISSVKKTGVASIEESDNAPDAVLVAASGESDAADLINDYELKTHGQRAVRVIKDDESIAAQVKKSPEESKDTNSPGVLIEKNDSEKMAVVSNEERVVKETEYAPKAEKGNEGPLPVDKEAEGIVVRSTTKSEAPDKITSKKVVSHEQTVAKETTYDNNQHEDVGSSTKAQLINTKKPTRKVVSKEDVEAQDGKVVGKVRRTNERKTVDGIMISSSVGSASESDGEVEFSSNSDIVGTEATFSGDGEAVTDLSGPSPEAYPGVSIVDDSNIDVDDILGEL